MTELIWDGKYKDGKKVAPVRIALPFQTIETINESTQDRQRSLDMFSSGHDSEWRNRLIWGDKKYVLPSLLSEFSGKIKLIYIDPPFDTGANFSFTATIPESPDEEMNETFFLKEPSVLENKAYRDIWGKGQTKLDSYLQWFYETMILLRDLLADDGTIYVHLDQTVSHYAKVVLDEVFGVENYLTTVIWAYQTRHSSDRFWNRKHDDLLFYKKSNNWTFNWRDPEVMQKLSPETIKKYKLKDEKGFYRLSGRFLKGSPIKGAKDVDPKWEKTNPELVVRDYLRPGMPPNDTFFIPIENQSSSDRTGYPTQKPTALLRKLILASSNELDLVLDCFCGSGTSAAVSEQLNRRWICCDLGRFAIQTTRKRLLSLPDVKPFIVQNLGKYERQAWHAAEFSNASEQKQKELNYRRFILDLYKAEHITGYTWLHGIKKGRMVHVGAVDAPVTLSDIKAIAAEVWKSVGKGKNSAEKAAVDVLGWDFALEVNEVAAQVAAEAKVDVHFRVIPREVLEQKAVEQGDIKFFELASLSAKVKAKGLEAIAELFDFIIPPQDVPDEIQKSISHFSQWVDYWAIDWDYKGDTFHNEWQCYRSKSTPQLELQASHTYEAAGEYQVVVKVIDILGNDTTKLLKVKVGDGKKKG